MKRSVEHYLLACDENDIYGLRHNKTAHVFDSFWTGARGIFHDVFEHYFETTHKYFKGDAAFNIAGEIVAMGHLAYYIYELGLWNRLTGDDLGIYSMDQAIIGTTEDHVASNCIYGDNYFGEELISCVPRQQRLSGPIECIIEEHWDRVQLTALNKPIKCERDEREYANCVRWRKSLTLGKLQNLYRYGFRMAAKLVPVSSHNRETLDDFITFWNSFCISNSAEEVALGYKAVDFKLKTNTKNIAWSAKLLANDYGIIDVDVKEYAGFPILDQELYED